MTNQNVSTHLAVRKAVLIRHCLNDEFRAEDVAQFCSITVTATYKVEQCKNITNNHNLWINQILRVL